MNHEMTANIGLWLKLRARPKISSEFSMPVPSVSVSRAKPSPMRRNSRLSRVSSGGSRASAPAGGAAPARARPGGPDPRGFGPCELDKEPPQPVDQHAEPQHARQRVAEAKAE